MKFVSSSKGFSGRQRGAELVFQENLLGLVSQEQGPGVFFPLSCLLCPAQCGNTVSLLHVCKWGTSCRGWLWGRVEWGSLSPRVQVGTVTCVRGLAWKEHGEVAM